MPYRTKLRQTNFWRTKFFGGQNFRHQVKVSAILSAEKFCTPKILSAKVLSDEALVRYSLM